MRKALINRKTLETDISLDFNIDGKGVYEIDSGIPFLDHMLSLFAKHGIFDLKLKAVGDLHIDSHHTMEDIGLAFGEAIQKAVGDKKGIKRYGFFILPMDDVRVTVSLDLSGRPYLFYDVIPPASHINGVDARLFHEFFQALVSKSGMNLHIVQHCGEEIHHLFEAIFKAFAKSLDMALTVDERIADIIPSTKGIL